MSLSSDLLVRNVKNGMENYNTGGSSLVTAAAAVRHSRPVAAADNKESRFVLMSPLPLPPGAAGRSLAGLRARRVTELRLRGGRAGRCPGQEDGSEISDIPAVEPQSSPLRKVRTLL